MTTGRRGLTARKFGRFAISAAPTSSRTSAPIRELPSILQHSVVRAFGAARLPAAVSMLRRGPVSCSIDDVAPSQLCVYAPNAGATRELALPEQRIERTGRAAGPCTPDVGPGALNCTSIVRSSRTVLLDTRCRYSYSAVQL